MAKSYVVIKRRKLDEFIRRGNKISDIEVRVGQLSGKPKYPAGHVGSKSRRPGGSGYRVKPKELVRRAFLRASRKQLEGLTREARSATLKQLRAQFKAQGMSSKGLGRKRAVRTPVARVAGVLQARSGYHLTGMQRARKGAQREIDMLQRALLGRGNVAAILKNVGQRRRDEVRASIRSAGHKDTGRLLRNTKYEIISVRKRITGKGK